MDALACDVLDNLLPELAGHDTLLRKIGKRLRDADDVALSHLALEAEQEVGRGEMEEVQRVRLHDLPVVEQAAQLLGGRRERPIAGDEVHRLGGGELVAHRADAAEALPGDRHFPVRPSAHEDLEAAKLDDVQPDLVNAILIVEQDGHLAVTFDASDRVDCDAAKSVRRLCGFEIEHGFSLSRNASNRDRGAACARGSDR